MYSKYQEGMCGEQSVLEKKKKGVQGLLRLKFGKTTNEGHVQQILERFWLVECYLGNEGPKQEKDGFNFQLS